MPFKARTKQEEINRLQEVNRSLRRSGFGTNLAKVLNSLIKWGSLVWLGLFAKDVLIEWAGKVTIANVSVRGALGEQNSDGSCGWLLLFALIVVLIAIAYGAYQSRLRKTLIERLTGRQIELEKKIDQNRTSSGITPKGKTRPEDL